MPTKEAAELQHSREFVEEQDAAVMRQTPVAKGDFHNSRRSTHPDLNLTKSDVKVTMKICSGSPARSVRNSHPMPFFTPDSGMKRCEDGLGIIDGIPQMRGRLITVDSNYQRVTLRVLRDIHTPSIRHQRWPGCVLGVGRTSFTPSVPEQVRITPRGSCYQQFP